MRYLELNEGEIEIQFDELKNYIGRSIRYLPERDIDKSGRGYFFPRIGTIQEKIGRRIMISGNDYSKSSIREIVLLPVEY